MGAAKELLKGNVGEFLPVKNSGLEALFETAVHFVFGVLIKGKFLDYFSGKRHSPSKSGR